VILGRVVGFVWATRKDARLQRDKLVVVQPYGWPTHDSANAAASARSAAEAVIRTTVYCVGS